MLDILFDNPIIMAAIIAAISFIFNKLGKNDENEEAKRKPAPEQQRTQTPKPKQTAQHRPAKIKTSGRQRQLQTAQIWKQSSAESKKMPSVPCRPLNGPLKSRAAG